MAQPAPPRRVSRLTTREIPGSTRPILPLPGYHLALIHPDYDSGGYWAEVPELPGCVAEGESLAEVERNIRDAADLYLAPDPIPGPGHLHLLMGGGWLLPTLILVGAVTLWTLLSGPRKGR